LPHWSLLLAVSLLAVSRPAAAGAAPASRLDRQSSATVIAMAAAMATAMQLAAEQAGRPARHL
jgi:hypothetical protein